MDNSERQPYEQQDASNRYTYFSAFKNVLPQYIFDQLIGITPQKRRAFLLQRKYLTPLTFDYSLLQFFSQFSVNTVILHLVKLFWERKGSSDPIMFFLIVIALGIVYLIFRWTQAKNTVTIREEIFYRSVVDLFSVIFSVIVTFNINQYWAK